jgi:hypothetical protein
MRSAIAIEQGSATRTPNRRPVSTAETTRWQPARPARLDPCAKGEIGSARAGPFSERTRSWIRARRRNPFGNTPAARHATGLRRGCVIGAALRQPSSSWVCPSRRRWRACILSNTGHSQPLVGLELVDTPGNHALLTVAAVRQNGGGGNGHDDCWNDAGQLRSTRINGAGNQEQFRITIVVPNGAA